MRSAPEPDPLADATARSIQAHALIAEAERLLDRANALLTTVDAFVATEEASRSGTDYFPVALDEDLQLEHERLRRQIAELQREHDMLEQRPMNIVEHRADRAKLQDQIRTLRGHMARLGADLTTNQTRPQMILWRADGYRCEFWLEAGQGCIRLYRGNRLMRTRPGRGADAFNQAEQWKAAIISRPPRDPE